MKTNRSDLKLFWLIAAAPLAIVTACMHVKVDPVEIKPITLNINIKYIDDTLDNVFAYEKQDSQSPAATRATTQSAAPVGKGGEAINANYTQ